MAEVFFRPLSNAAGLVEKRVVDYGSESFEDLFQKLVSA